MRATVAAKRFYSAEYAVESIFDRQYEFPLIQIAGSTVEVPAERKFADIESIQRYADLVCERNNLPPVKARAMRTDARMRAYYRWGTINFPVQSGRWSLRETVVLHEIAHHASRNEYADHGPEFAGQYVKLVRDVMGDQAAFILQVTLFESKVPMA